MSTPGVSGPGQTPSMGKDQGVKGDPSSYKAAGGSLDALKNQLIVLYGKKDGTKAYKSIMKTMEISQYNMWKNQQARVKAAEKKYGQSFK